MTTRSTPSSSWIAALRYIPFASSSTPPVAGTNGFLVVTSRTGTSYAYPVPAHLFGLLLAHCALGRSVGSLYNRWVRGRYPSIKLEQT